MFKLTSLTFWVRGIAVVSLNLIGLTAADAQLAPEIGYIHPAGVQAGTTTEVTLGGYDWTPDMQIFSHDRRVKLELIGPPTPVLISEPPYWFGAKARGYAWPLPREFRARLTVAPDVPSGFVRWQVANANGVSPLGLLHVGSIPEVQEFPHSDGPQFLERLPVTVSGKIQRIEDVDRYRIHPPSAGPITVELLARQLTSPTNPMALHGIFRVHDDAGRCVVDAAATEGLDLRTTFAAEADRDYILSLHDLDFAGDRSYVYRLVITPGPAVAAAYPAAGRRGETLTVQFVGWGIATGKAQLESVTREITFPSDPSAESVEYVLETPFGNAKPYSFGLSQSLELVEGVPFTDLPAAMTGKLDIRYGSDTYPVSFRKGDVWQIRGMSRTAGLPLDIELRLLTPDGKELLTADDLPGTTDAELLFTVPEDGIYQLVVSDRSGRSGNDAAAYRVSIERPQPSYSIIMPDLLSIPLGTSTKLPVTATRHHGFVGPITIEIQGLVEAITVSSPLLIAEDKNELAIELACSMDAAASASLVTVTATSSTKDTTNTRLIKTLVVATTMKPRIKITPEGLDDVSKVHRGSTHLFPLLIERLEGFTGEITLEMTAKQQRHRQGLASEELVVGPSINRVEYPIFVPEWMETTKTSRMILNGAAQVADPKGNLRTLLQRMELRLGMLPEGALMKLAHSLGEYHVQLGHDLVIPLNVSRAAELQESIVIEAILSESQTGRIATTPISLAPHETSASMKLHFENDAALVGETSVLIRATARQRGKWLVKSETTVPIEIRK
ncbi:PPC domain-containing protein [Schlesneria paludicola]|uniref:PPC domain-containing protein n=1 Tax=Schlesneria paludicola TaxID=360056 RepID=UPI00029B468D|nr:PPC domain-containing protein [Schlesneria paludicola]